jgi:ABC-type transport system involved in multi-copper enzyme maturation permease subunit
MSQPILLGFLGNKAASTLTPLWLLGIGILLGMVLIAVAWVLLLGLSRVLRVKALQRASSEVWTSIREGVLFHLLIVATVFGAIGVVGTIALRPVGESWAILGSLPRLGSTGTLERTMTLPGTPAGGGEELVIPPVQEFPIWFRGDELVALEIRSTENIAVSQSSDAEMDTRSAMNVMAGEPSTWRKRPNMTSPFGDTVIEKLYMRNRGVDDAVVSVSVTTDVVYPEVRVIPIAAGTVFVVFLLYFLQATLMPRISAIALATFKSEVAQPLFVIIMSAGIVLLVLSIYIPYNTFGEDIKMLKDAGLTLIRVLCILLAVWGASTTLADEIEGRTALTVLSKPVHRRSFVIGKFLGIGWTTALMFVVLGSVLLAVVSYKMIYDARETSTEVPTWPIVYIEMMSTVPGLVLAFMETMILAALSVAISTRLPMFANFMICFTVYVLGHLIPLISQASEGQFEIVKFVGRFSAAVFPNLEAFDIQSALAGGLAVPQEYLGVSLVYCLLFSAVAMLLALILFEDRDLA